MDNKTYDKVTTKVVYLVAAIVIIAIVYFIFVKPYVVFRSYEKQTRKAGEEYYQINHDKLPTGKRVDTVDLATLSTQKYLDRDFTIPLSSKLCDYQNSWVKVRYEGNDYKYYVYLDCGYMESKVDHDGPIIKLNGDQNMTVTKKEKFTDPGVSSVIDKNDGKMKVEDVTVSGEVNTNVTGTYKLTYTAFDSLKNKTEIVRTIKVIDTITSITKREGAKGYFPGDAVNNYINFSNQLYRIIGLDGDDVKIVSDKVVGVANYTAIDKQLKKYYETLSPKSKKLIVKNKYCNDKLSGKNLDTTECSSFTDEKDIYVPSVADINKIKTYEESFLNSGTFYWTSNMADDNYAYLKGDSIPGSRVAVNKMINTYNGGIKPVVTVKGDLIISNGLGTLEKPYIIDKDVKASKNGELVNSRLPGEYININGNAWRIIEPQEDGTTKIILNNTITTTDQDLEYDDAENERYEYNPKVKNTYAYYINNKANTYIQSEKFVSHEIKVPIYKSKILFGKAEKTKTYKVKLSAPSLYDLYTISLTNDDYLVLDSSKDESIFYYMDVFGNPIKRRYDPVDKYSVKPVAFLKRGIKVIQGSGSEADPYIIE